MPHSFFPAILSGDIQQVQDQLDAAQEFDKCPVVHIDLLDGYFADNFTVTPADLATCEFGSLECDLHIMAVDPEDVVNEIIEFASSLPVRAVIGQVERMGSEQSFVDAVRRQGWKPGLSFDVGSSLESIDEDIWNEVQIAQVMGVPAGEQGQPFVARSLDLVDELYQQRLQGAHTFEIFVDGGIRTELLPKLDSHHVDGCPLGSALWKSGNPQEAWQQFSQTIV